MMPSNLSWVGYGNDGLHLLVAGGFEAQPDQALCVCPYLAGEGQTSSEVHSAILNPGY